MSPDENGTATIEKPATASGGILDAAKEQVQSEAAAAVDTRGEGTGLTRPADIPENFWDAKTGTVKTADAIKSWREITKQRDQLTEQLKKGNDPAPDSPEKYLSADSFNENGVLKLPDTLKNWGDIKKDDPVLNALAKGCLESGIGQNQFKALLPKLMESISPMLPPQIDVPAELAKLDGGQEGRGKAMVDMLTNQINRLESGGDFATDEAAFLRNIGATAFGVRVLAKLMNQRATQAIPTGPSLQGSAPGVEDWKAMIHSPEYSVHGPIGDAYRAKVRALGERLFPGSQE